MVEITFWIKLDFFDHLNESDPQKDSSISNCPRLCVRSNTQHTLKKKLLSQTFEFTKTYCRFNELKNLQYSRKMRSTATNQKYLPNHHTANKQQTY